MLAEIGDIMWECPRESRRGHDCRCRETIENVDGIYVCDRCFGVVQPGEGNEGRGAGIAPKTREQKKAFAEDPVPYRKFPKGTVLKPCPFCGENNWEPRQIDRYVHIGQMMYDAKCEECKAEVIGNYYGMDNKLALKAVIKAINRRPK